jgi:hypothetical protein
MSLNFFMSCSPRSYRSQQGFLMMPASYTANKTARLVAWIAKRVINQIGLIAVVGYNLLRSDPEINVIKDLLYSKTIKPFWVAEREYLEEAF